MKQVTGAAKVEDKAPCEQENFGKQSVILRSDWCSTTHFLVSCYVVLGVMHICSAHMQSAV